MSEIVSLSERDPIDREGEFAIELLVPDDDVPNPVVSIVVPAVNEKLTISEFALWCQQGLRDADVCGEVLIVDSSSDGTAGLALAGGGPCLAYTENADWDAPTLMPLPTSVGDTW